ncbi:hypothetical protein KEJ39_07810, partial [Candidatus Bathyarchaeota archaeon]|nr:hypothetical protein [Candidatus Bathyarchaeota archaeon]
TVLVPAVCGFDSHTRLQPLFCPIIVDCANLEAVLSLGIPATSDTCPPGGCRIGILVGLASRDFNTNPFLIRRLF